MVPAEGDAADPPENRKILIAGQRNRKEYITDDKKWSLWPLRGASFSRLTIVKINGANGEGFRRGGAQMKMLRPRLDHTYSCGSCVT